MSYKIYCTHHKPLVHRKEYLEQKKTEYNFDFEYVESHEPGTPEFTNNYRINNAELSVTLKIFDIFKKVIEENIDYCFIFEDDIIIEFNLINYFEKIISESENIDIVFWGGTYDRVVSNPTPEKLVYPGYHGSRAGHGIMYTKEACIKILENYDYSFSRQYDLTIDSLINKIGFRCAWTYPHVRQKTVEGLEGSSLR